MGLAAGATPKAAAAAATLLTAGAGAAGYYVWRSRQAEPETAEPKKRVDDLTPEELKAEMDETFEELCGLMNRLDHYGAYSSECIAPGCDPMVLLVGNHSSGKSTFINNLCDGKIQEVGNAPTDDGFTVIQNGTVPVNEDGYTAAARCDDSAKGFDELTHFGHAFVQHFKRKVRNLGPNATLPPGVVVVDTPGTIDTPTPEIGREYDFTRVVRWFVRRAAVVLLFFDPANPGTTGETLEILNEALVDQTHKFLIVLNKVDTLDNVLDFARAYGTLCWNLSKVLNKKDIPRIYTMYNPRTGVQSAELNSKLPNEEFNRARLQVLNEIRLAPERHNDNAVATLEEAAKKLLMLYRVCAILPYRIPSELKWTAAAASGVALAVSAGVKKNKWLAALSCLGVVLSTASACVFDDDMQGTVLDKLFELRYRSSLRNTSNVDVRDRWQDVKGLMSEVAFSKDLHKKYRQGSAEAEAALAEVMETRLPRLRALVEKQRNSMEALGASV